MTTRGASELKLHQHWQAMGALEAVAGMLMFGINTAYMLMSCCSIGQTYRPSGSARKTARTPDLVDGCELLAL